MTLVTTTSATATGWVPHKIAEMLRWCQEAGIEMATVYLLSTENLQRDPDELASLIEIITDVVEEICAPANQWSVRTVGDLELLGEEPARRLRDAVESTRPQAAAGSFHVNVAVGYGGRQEIVDAVRALLGKELANGATGEQLIEAVTVDGDLGEPVHLRPARPRSGDPHLGGAAAVRVPAVAERVLGDVVHRGVLAGVPARGLPARAARLHRAAPPLRALSDVSCASLWLRCRVVFALSWWLGLYLLARDPRKPVLVLAAVGLTSFAVVVALDAVRAGQRLRRC